MSYSVDDKLNGLRVLSQRKLIDILDKIPGNIDFIIEPNLIKPLERIIGVQKLRSHGVDKIYRFEKTETPCTNTQRVFLVKANLTTVKHVCDKINSELSQRNDGNSYHVILVARRHHAVVNLFEEEGIYGNVTLHQFQWELIQLDNRIFSMEFDEAYRNLFIDNDQSCLSSLAKSIWTLHLLFGKPRVTLVQGKYSKLMDNMIDKFHEELASPKSSSYDISCFFIVDRDLDYPSVLLTGSTYTALIDEVYSIRSGIAELKPNDAAPKPVSYHLNSSDEVYANIKSRHFSSVLPYLDSIAKELSATDTKGMSLNEVKHFVSKELPKIQNLKAKLAFHIGASGGIISKMGQRFEKMQSIEHSIIQCVNKKEILNYIENCLAMNICDKYGILRLLCLLSISQDGLFHDELHRLKFQYLQMFGYQHLPTFHFLEKANLCVEQPSLVANEVKGGHLANKVVQAVPLPTRRSNFTLFSQKLKLLPNSMDGCDLKNPKEPEYVFNGTYVPAICRIVQMLIKSEKSPEEIAKLLPNCTLKKTTDSAPPKSFVVYVVGGVTYNEIAAFQLIERLTGSQIVVAASNIINGNSLMKSFCIP